MVSAFAGDPITLTKLEAARRQLRTAAELWFTGGDEVSALALAHSSHEIIHRLYRNRGHSSLLYDTVLIKDEYRAEYARFLKEAPNFFKHAKQDADDASITFKPGMIAIFLMMSVYALAVMDETLTDVEKVTSFWFTLHFPSETFIQSTRKKGLPVDTFQTLTSKGREEFFQAALKAVNRKSHS